MNRSVLGARLDMILSAATAILQNSGANAVTSHAFEIRDTIYQIKADLDNTTTKVKTEIVVHMDKEQLDELVSTLENEIDNGSVTTDQARLYGKLADIQDATEAAERAAREI